MIELKHLYNTYINDLLNDPNNFCVTNWVSTTGYRDVFCFNPITKEKLEIHKKDLIDKIYDKKNRYSSKRRITLSGLINEIEKEIDEVKAIKMPHLVVSEKEYYNIINEFCKETVNELLEAKVVKFGRLGCFQVYRFKPSKDIKRLKVHYQETKKLKAKLLEEGKTLRTKETPNGEPYIVFIDPSIEAYYLDFRKFIFNVKNLRIYKYHIANPKSHSCLNPNNIKIRISKLKNDPLAPLKFKSKNYKKL